MSDTPRQSVPVKVSVLVAAIQKQREAAVENSRQWVEDYQLRQIADWKNVRDKLSTMYFESTDKDGIDRKAVSALLGYDSHLYGRSRYDRNYGAEQVVFLDQDLALLKVCATPTIEVEVESRWAQYLQAAEDAEPTGS